MANKNTSQRDPWECLWREGVLFQGLRKQQKTEKKCREPSCFLPPRERERVAGALYPGDKAVSHVLWQLLVLLQFL